MFGVDEPSILLTMSYLMLLEDYFRLDLVDLVLLAARRSAQLLTLFSKYLEIE